MGSSHPLLQVLVGVLLIVALSWLAKISDAAGDVAVAVVVLLWFLWSMNNYSKINSFVAVATGRG